VVEVQAGQSSNFQPVFTVMRYVDRPADLLGPRIVAPPGARAAASGAPMPATPPVRPPVNHAPPVRQAPPDRWDDQRWDDQHWDAPLSARVPAVASTAGWADDAIPF